MVIIREGKIHQTYKLPPAKPGDPSHIYLVFNLSRANPMLATPLNAPDTSRPTLKFDVPTNVVQFDRNRLEQRHSKEIEIVADEPQELVKVIVAAPVQVGAYTVYESSAGPGRGSSAAHPVRAPSAALSAELRKVLPAERCEVLEERHRKVVKKVIQSASASTAAAAGGGPGDVCLDPSTAQPQPRQGDVTQEFLDAQSYHDALWSSIDGAQPIDRACQFFAELDRRTHLKLVEFWPVIQNNPGLLASWNATIDKVSGVLLERLEQRARTFCANSTGPASAYVPAAATLPDWEEVAAVFRQTVEDRLRDGEFEQAFEQFASGELRIQIEANNTNVWACQPSSGFFFLFAELALLILDKGHQTVFWEKVHNVMVRCQVIFSTVYAPATDSDDWLLAHYNACNFREPVREWWKGQTGGVANKKLLADLYAGASLHELHQLVAVHTGVFLPGYCPPPPPI